MKNKVINVLIVITSLILIVALFILGLQLVSSSTEKLDSKFNENVVINGVSVKGLTKKEATSKISNVLNKKIEDINVKLTYQDKTWELKRSDFEVNSSIHTVVDDAYRYSQLNQNATDAVKKIQSGGYEFNLAFNHIFLNFDEKLNEIKSEIEIEPINSIVEFIPDSAEIFKISKSQSGLKVNTDKIYKDIEEQFAITSNISVNIETNNVLPEVTESYFDGKLEKLGEFSTDLSTSKGGRKNNVALALSKFNGKIVKPNEEVSFNAVTGPQTAETGYQSAIVIVNGEYVEGIGGGICQASTTLYNALILSGVQIDEVHKHTLPVGYVELSLDAMVNEGTADMRFKNISEYPIYIKACVQKDRAYAWVYGCPLEEGVTFKRSVEFVRTIPHSGDKIVVDEKGEYSDKVIYKDTYFRINYPKEGYEAKGYLEKYKDGVLIDKKLIRHEIYEPQKGLVIEGAVEKPKDKEIYDNGVSPIPPQIESETSAEYIQEVINLISPPMYNP